MSSSGVVSIQGIREIIESGDFDLLIVRELVLTGFVVARRANQR